MLNYLIINSKLRKRIAKLGNMTQSYEEVIEKIVEHAEQCDRWWEDR
jgi:hypothetical protein